jgi:hypothetical protein
VTLDSPVARPNVHRLFRHDHAHGRATLPEYRSGVGIDREADDVDQGVGGNLV